MSGIDADALRSRMGDLGIGTAHNTLANEGDDEDNTTGASSSNQDVAMNIDE